MKIANIVSKNKIQINEYFNVVNSIDDIIQGLPTLIIGYDYVVKHYPDFNILNFKLDDNLYWIFKKNEDKDRYDYYLWLFINKVYVNLIQNVSYIFVDPINYNKNTLYKIIRKIKSLTNIISYINNNMIYIYSNHLIFGIDLKLLEYIGFNKQPIKDKIKEMSLVFLEDNNILIEYKKIIEELDNQIKYIPYLYYIKNE